MTELIAHLFLKASSTIPKEIWITLPLLLKVKNNFLPNFEYDKNFSLK